MKVPFVDVAQEWADWKPDALCRIGRVFDHGQFINGPEVAELEQSLSITLNDAHVIGCGSGTTALLMTMMALGIGPGDEVVMPAFTFAAPAECAMILGATPVFADVACPTGHVTAQTVAAAIGPKTKVIVAVSLFGVPIEYAAIQAVAKDHDLPLIEDAAQSYGAARGGLPSGTLGQMGCLSFFPTKTFGGAGDGGAVVTQDDELAHKLRQIRDHGQDGKYAHIRLGLNGRMSSIAAASLLARMPSLQSDVQRRRQIANRYIERLTDARNAGKLDFFEPAGDQTVSGAQFPVLVANRDQLANSLRNAGIQTAVYYPKGLHQQPAFETARLAGQMAGVERMAKDVLCLPIFPGLTDAQQNYVCKTLLNASVLHDHSVSQDT